jgi:hypothetical protein
MAESHQAVGHHIAWTANDFGYTDEQTALLKGCLR